MSQSVLPIQIKPHLIPFFYQEFKGVEANYLNKKVKACKISTDRSLGLLIRTTIEKTHLPDKSKNLHLFISVSDNEGKKKYAAKIYKCVSGQFSFLKVPKETEERVNDILEDYFKIAYIYYMLGARHFSPDETIKNQIVAFMRMYDLDEYGYLVESLRRYYNRESEENAKRLKRVQRTIQAHRI